MADRLDELGVAGYLDERARARLRDLDVDTVHSIGLAGPFTPELLLKIHEIGADLVASFAHEIATGPFDPDDFHELLWVGIDEVRGIVAASGLDGALDPAEVVSLVRSRNARA